MGDRESMNHSLITQNTSALLPKLSYGMQSTTIGVDLYVEPRERPNNTRGLLKLQQKWDDKDYENCLL